LRQGNASVSPAQRLFTRQSVAEISMLSLSALATMIFFADRANGFAKCGWNGRPYIANGRELLASIPRGGPKDWSVQQCTSNYTFESQLFAWALRDTGLDVDPFPNISGTISIEPLLPELLSAAQLELAGMPTDQRETWQSSALAEHAAISSFAKLTLELLVAGVPSHLVRQAIRAQEEELLHAQISFTLGSSQTTDGNGSSLQFPEHGLAIERDFFAMRTAAMQEGVMHEGHAALDLFRSAAGFLKDNLAIHLAKIVWGIARDEARHAALAAQVVEWLDKQMGHPLPSISYHAGRLQILEELVEV